MRRATKRGAGRLLLLAVAAAALLPVARAGAAGGDVARAGYALGAGTVAESLTLGAEGDLWFAGYDYTPGPGEAAPVAVVGRLTPTGEEKEFPVRARPLDPSTGATFGTGKAIAVGPEGDLWATVTDDLQGQIARVTPSGEVTEFPLPNAPAEATSIAAGPDGALWFTVEADDRIDRITPTGSIAELPLPAGSRPRAIAAGADGAMWFTEYGSRKIGRIAADGSVAEYALPAGTGAPNRLALGADGRIWFTESIAAGVGGYDPALSDEIGRIDPDGTFAFFPVAAQSGGTGAIVAGPEGRIWFSTGRGPTAEVESITPAGRSGLPICAGACGSPVSGLAVGPDGRLWASYQHPYNAGGGGSGEIELLQPGRIGPLDLSPAVALGLEAAPLRGHRTSIEVECRARHRCRGKLVAKSGLGLPARVVARAAYSLPAGARRRVPLSVDPTGLKLLRRYEGSYPLLVAAVAGSRRLALRTVTLARTAPAG